MEQQQYTDEEYKMIGRMAVEQQQAHQAAAAQQDDELRWKGIVGLALIVPGYLITALAFFLNANYAVLWGLFGAAAGFMALTLYVRRADAQIDKGIRAAKISLFVMIFMGLGLETGLGGYSFILPAIFWIWVIAILAIQKWSAK